MQAYQVDIRSVFPDAPAPGTITLHSTPIVDANVRNWERLGLGLTLASIVPMLLVEVTESMQLFAAAMLTCVTGLMLLVIGRLKANAGRLASRRIEWSDWGAERGLVPTAHDGLVATDLPVFTAGHGREWDGLHAGRIAAVTSPVTVGSCAYSKGSGKTQRRLHMFFVHVRLSSGAAACFPHSNVRRFCNTPVEEMDTWFGNEVRFESIDLDETHEIEVAASADPRAWRALFGPQLMHAMTNLHEMQWTQVGQDIIFGSMGEWRERLFGRLYRPKAPVEQLDSLCAAASFVTAHIERTAEAFGARQAGTASS